MSPPSETRPQGHKLVIIIPALNEEPTVAETIRQIPVDIPGVYCAEVLVVDDGSTDSTA